MLCGEMFVQPAGSGLPEIVLVHGFACDHTDWAAQLAELGRAHAVLACDLRGHGKTPGELADASIERLGADVARLLAQRELEEAILVGHSMGTRVVLEAYRSAPERVAGLVLVDGSQLGSGDPVQVEAATRATIDAAGFPAFVEAVFKQMFLGPSDDATRIIARAKRLPAAFGTALFARMLRWDAASLEAALDAVRVPLMIIQSTTMSPEHKRVPIAAGQTTPWLDLVRRHVPSARIETITGVGHFSQIEAPGRLSGLLMDFADSLSESRP